MNYRLLPMDRSHLPQVCAIEDRCFTKPWSEGVWAEELYNDMASCVVAQTEEGTVLGYGVVSVVLDEGCLEKIAVDPAARRQGVAEAILRAFLRFGAVHLAFLTLEVRASNEAAIRLYEKLGFQEVGRRKNYYSDIREDAILMTREFERNGTI